MEVEGAGDDERGFDVEIAQVLLSICGGAEDASVKILLKPSYYRHLDIGK